ncbi:MAG: DUF4367 domain-containing protein [Gracilibacteraceae bacterium]|jgi:hypothetical protein|nr:DUF4367 domain-containing protein [Gracilibacteraceae bacterium]
MSGKIETLHESLNEAFFDALLSAALSERLEEEMSALEARLAEMSEPPVSKKFERRVKKALRRASGGGTGLTRLAAGLLIFLTLTCAGVMSVEATRLKVFDFFTEMGRGFVSVHVVPDEGGVLPAALLAPAYLPEGYAAAETKTLAPGIVHSEYENTAGAPIRLTQYIAQTPTVSVDTDHKEQRTIEINGREAVLFEALEPGTNHIIIWQAEESTMMLSGAVPVDELVRMAESVRAR